MVRSERQVHVERVMGTVVSIHVRSSKDARHAFEATSALLAAVDRRFSTYAADSEVSRYNRGELDGAPESELMAVVARCEALRLSTGGAFDARAGGAFDPSAWVKGWSVDRAGSLLTDLGYDDWSINAGGDVLVSAPPEAAPWRIGVQHPTDPSALATVLHARHLAVATSGSYFRGDHVLDPRTGNGARAALSTTVCGSSLGMADALSTAAFVLGPDGAAMVGEHPGYECWTVLSDSSVLSTGGFPRVVHGVPVMVDRFDPVIGVAA